MAAPSPISSDGRFPNLITRHEADDTEAIWHRVWWGLHFGGRGGPTVLALSALDIALWNLKARRANLPLRSRAPHSRPKPLRSDGSTPRRTIA